VVPDDEVTDATDDDPECQAGGRQVHRAPEAHLALEHVRQRRNYGAGDASDQRDAALPDAEDPYEVVTTVGYFGEVTEDVAEPRSDDRSEQCVEENVPDIGFVGAPALARAPHHQLRAGEESHRDTDPMRRDLEGAETEARDDVPRKRIPETHGARRSNSRKHS
jgi:hypothetical protein